MELSELENDFGIMVADLKKDPKQIQKTLTAKQLSALSACMYIQYGLLDSALGSLIPVMHEILEGKEKGLPINDLEPEAYDNLHMTIGVSGELGELLDSLKKQIIYEKEFDRANFVEELGDILFYSRGMGKDFYDAIKSDMLFVELLEYGGTTVKECIEANIKKLSDPVTGRYKNGKYSNQQAQERNDKKVH